MEKRINNNLICIQSGSTMNDARKIMHHNRIRHLPILNHKNQVESILSKHDLTDVQSFQSMPVDLFASFPVQFMHESTPISVVALKMIEEKISALIICNDQDQAVGIITTDDLLFELSRILKEKESKTTSTPIPFDLITTAGSFFRKLADIGI